MWMLPRKYLRRNKLIFALFFYKIKSTLNTMSLFNRPQAPEEASWLTQTEDGQLSIDVFRQGKELIIRSTLAGVSPDDLDIAIHGDLLTIRGKRESSHETKEDDWFHRECYWGSFSRTIILPLDVESDRAEASLEHGVLEIRIPIRGGEHSIKIRTVED